MIQKLSYMLLVILTGCAGAAESRQAFVLKADDFSHYTDEFNAGEGTLCQYLQ